MDFESFSPVNIKPDNFTIPYLKRHIQDFSDWQIEAFKNKYDITQLVELRARYIDELLIQLWDFVGLSESYDLSLIAVGGYGRGELHPKSDIDLLILSDSGFSQQSEAKISELITLLWDLKLDIGQSSSHTQ
ncbi:nucleotidyltransferase domain-containing protein [Psychromonas sp. KJ10-10]|uniref:nucleotidyltransferase domain-containing protein n=1 Tax=Psychromonas sp. KJ10-10 TaxID=3391823 RepID=UPI0039B596D3